MPKYTHNAAVSAEIAKEFGTELQEADVRLVMDALLIDSPQLPGTVSHYPNTIEGLQDFTLHCIKKGRAARHFFFIHNISRQIVILPPYEVPANRHTLDDHMAWICEIKAPEIIQQNLNQIQEIPQSTSAEKKPAQLLPKKEKSSLEDREDPRPKFASNLAAKKKIELFCNYIYLQTTGKKKADSTPTYDEWLNNLFQYIEECPLPCYFEKDGKHLRLVIILYDKEQSYIVGNVSDFLNLLEEKERNYVTLTLQQKYCLVRSLTLFPQRILQLTKEELKADLAKSLLKVIFLAIEHGSIAISDPILYDWLDHLVKNFGKSFSSFLTQEMALNLFKYLYGHFLENIRKAPKKVNHLREMLSYFVPFLIEEEITSIFLSELPAAEVIWFIEKIEPTLICATVGAVLNWASGANDLKDKQQVLLALDRCVWKLKENLNDAQRAIIASFIAKASIDIKVYPALSHIAQQYPTVTPALPLQHPPQAASTARLPASSVERKRQRKQPTSGRRSSTQRLEPLQGKLKIFATLKEYQHLQGRHSDTIYVSLDIPKQIEFFLDFLSSEQDPRKKKLYFTKFYESYMKEDCYHVRRDLFFNAIEYCMFLKKYDLVIRMYECCAKHIDTDSSPIFKASFEKILPEKFRAIDRSKAEHNSVNLRVMHLSISVTDTIGDLFTLLDGMDRLDNVLVEIKKKYLEKFYLEYIASEPKPYAMYSVRSINAVEYSLLLNQYPLAIRLYKYYKDHEKSARIFQNTLYAAIEQTNLQAVQVCLDVFRCDPNKDKQVFAMCCAHPKMWLNISTERIHRLLEIIKLLVEAGGNPYHCRREEEVDGFGPSLLDLVVSSFDSRDPGVKGLITFLKARGIEHITGPEFYPDVYFPNNPIWFYTDLLMLYIENPSASIQVKDFLNQHPEFINTKFIYDRRLVGPIIFIAICRQDEKFLAFLLENFSPYLGKRKMPSHFYENDLVSPLDAAVYEGFSVGVGLLLAYGSPPEVADNIFKRASPEIVSLLNAHAGRIELQTAGNQSVEPYSPFWETPLPLAVESSATKSLERSDSESDDEVYSGFTPMALCRII